MDNSIPLPDSVKYIDDFSGVRRIFDRWDPSKQIVDIISSPINPNPYNIKKGCIHPIFHGTIGYIYALIEGKSILVGKTDAYNQSTHYDGNFNGEKGTPLEGTKQYFKSGSHTNLQEEFNTWIISELTKYYPNDYKAEKTLNGATVQGNIDNITYTIITNVSQGTVQLQFEVGGEKYSIPSLGIEKNKRKWKHFLKVQTDNTKLRNQIRQEFTFEDLYSKKAIEKLLKKIKSHLSRSHPKFQELRNFLKEYKVTN